jgi:hypothetical protein
VRPGVTSEFRDLPAAVAGDPQAEDPRLAPAKPRGPDLLAGDDQLEPVLLPKAGVVGDVGHLIQADRSRCPAMELHRLPNRGGAEPRERGRSGRTAAHHSLQPTGVPGKQLLLVHPRRRSVEPVCWHGDLCSGGRGLLTPAELLSDVPGDLVGSARADRTLRQSRVRRRIDPGEHGPPADFTGSDPAGEMSDPRCGVNRRMHL